MWKAVRVSVWCERVARVSKVRKVRNVFNCCWYQVVILLKNSDTAIGRFKGNEMRLVVPHD